MGVKAERADAAPCQLGPRGGEALLEGVIDELCRANECTFEQRGRQTLPSRAVIAALLDDLREVLYPVHFGSPHHAGRPLRERVGGALDRAKAALEGQVCRGLELMCQHVPDERTCDVCAARARQVTAQLLARLPEIRGWVDRDVQAALDGDPALQLLDEALFCYPGVRAILQHRIAHELHLQRVPLIPRIVSELGHSETGIDIHPGAKIGPSFFIDHGTGVVIGETALIGERVRLYQGVTLGARSFASDERGQLVKGSPRHPIVEDDVVIYAGATILGRVTIGKGAIIGGNVWLTRSVPAGSRVRQVQARQETFENGSGI